MKSKTENISAVRSAITSALAATIVFGSVFTVAATTVQTADSSVENISAVQTTTSENEFPNGDIIVTNTNNFDLSVSIIKANTVTIAANGSEQKVMLAKGTVADALDRAGIELVKTQLVNPSLDTEITEDTTINIYDGYNVTVTADGETTNAVVSKGTVRDTLKELGYTVGQDDCINYSYDTEISEGIKIVIQRVKYVEETETKTIAYNKKTEDTDELSSGESKVKTKGVDGEELITKKVKYIDGVKDSEEIVSTEVTKKAVDEVTLIGTKDAESTSYSGGNGTGVSAGTFTDSNGATISYSKVLTGSGTAYTAPTGALTATGSVASYGGVAVNPNIIPYGTKLYITSTDGSVVYGYATAVDTGGALMSGSALVDCFYSSYEECISFGRRNVNIYILS